MLSRYIYSGVYLEDGGKLRCLEVPTLFSGHTLVRLCTPDNAYIEFAA